MIEARHRVLVPPGFPPVSRPTRKLGKVLRDVRGFYGAICDSAGAEYFFHASRTGQPSLITGQQVTFTPTYYNCRDEAQNVEVIS